MCIRLPGMKAFVLPLIFFLCLSLFLPAQAPDYDQKFGLRVSAGRGEYFAFSSQFFPAYSIGLQYLKKLLRPNLALASGLNFTSLRVENAIGPFNYRHLQLPLALRMEGRALYFEAGTYADYLVLVNSSQSAFNPLDPKRKIAFGLNIAAGYELELSEKVHALLELRYLETLFGSAGYMKFRSYTLGLGINYAL